MSLFRHMIRIDYVEGSGSIDDHLVKFLDALKAESSYRQQEWFRNAIRNTFIEQRNAVKRDQDNSEQGCSEREV